jgi:DNA-binding LacI/PurR family transcriptional regulator
MSQRTFRATIKEVASAAGVSTQTVSRVINERPDVSPETRKRVQHVIDELGYQPSAVARSLIRQRSQTLGVVTAGLSYIGPSRTLSGIAGTAENAGYALLLKELPRFDDNVIEPIFQALLSHHVDGIIWAVSEVGENLNWVKKAPPDIGIPIVFLTMEPQDDTSIVSMDNYLGGRMAMSHLFEQGYRHIGHISGPLDWWEARQRKKAWEDGVIECGQKVNPKHWTEGNWSSESGGQAVEKLLTQYPEMDAIFIANDQMALSALLTLREKGLRVPQDIGIVGFDNIPESAYFLPPLTTVHQDQYEVARVAVTEIIKTIELNWQGQEDDGARTIILPPTLVVRQSSVRVKA